MENATKALIMAAGVLIGVLIISLAVYEFASFGISSSQIHKENEENRLNEFNSQFNKYEGKEEVTIYDVVTVANLATENNKYYEFQKRNTLGTGNDYYIWVSLQEEGFIENGYEGTKGSDYYNGLISKYNNIENYDGVKKMQQFECKTETSDITGRVYKVNFTKK